MIALLHLRSNDDDKDLIIKCESDDLTLTFPELEDAARNFTFDCISCADIYEIVEYDPDLDYQSQLLYYTDNPDTKCFSVVLGFGL